MKKLSRAASIISITVLFSLSLCPSARAQTVTLGQFQHPKTAKDLANNKIYLMGVTEGLLAFNMTAEDKLFCVPGLVPKITFDQASDAVMRWARKTTGSADLTVGRALLYGLKDLYPCH